MYSSHGARCPNGSCPFTNAKPVVWSPPPRVLDLCEREVHVWRASLECAPELARQLESTLSDDETNRAAQLHFVRDRGFFIAARGILRELAGAYLKCAPSELRFQYGPEGKPSVVSKNSDSQLRFNLSRTQGTALYTFACGRDVGIDVEAIRPDVATEAIAERFFTPRETAELRALPMELQAQGFFNCWTRKEAYIKARGQGLQIPLDSFDVALRPGAPAQFVQGVDSRWNLFAFSPGPNYVAALVFDGAPCEVLFFNFERQTSY
jgi:4'-phosphopantetheinyl transferase